MLYVYRCSLLDGLHFISINEALGPDGDSETWYFGCFQGVSWVWAIWKKNLNATFIVLIPKNSEAMKVKDFRLISLMDGVYKLIAKVLANRMQMVLRKFILGSQNAFVKENKF